MARFEGQGVVVTGAARGIGRATAERFVNEGAHAVIFDRDASAAASAAAELGATAVAGDAASAADLRQAIAACVDACGRLDVMVAHAGVSTAQPLLDVDEATWRRTLDVNLTGAFLATQEAGRWMSDHGGGSIVITASINAFHVEEELAAYNASKGGVVALVRSAAMELAPRGIRVNGVSPGVIDTRISEWVIRHPVLGPRYRETIPLGRFGTPPDVAGVIAFLASPDAAYVTGQVVVIDGGQTLGIRT
jgi:NAD(P)-dependent dehydrogenase (short-subunit alcohol dehydrogenase family)